MLTLHTTCPVASEPFSIPRLCLIGRAPPRGTTVDLTHIDVVPNMNLWPLFHNGVAAGLRINPTASNIDTAWIIYNKPKVCDLIYIYFKYNFQHCNTKNTVKFTEK